jgi:hypothetical protein
MMNVAVIDDIKIAMLNDSALAMIVSTAKHKTDKPTNGTSTRRHNQRVLICNSHVATSNGTFNHTDIPESVYRSFKHFLAPDAHTKCDAVSCEE